MLHVLPYIAEEARSMGYEHQEVCVCVCVCVQVLVQASQSTHTGRPLTRPTCAAQDSRGPHAGVCASMHVWVCVHERDLLSMHHCVPLSTWRSLVLFMTGCVCVSLCVCVCVCPQELDPELIHHLTKLGVPCVALTLPWICNAFVGYLPVRTHAHTICVRTETHTYTHAIALCVYGALHADYCSPPVSI